MPLSRVPACLATLLLSLSSVTTLPAHAWGREGHLMINRLAVQYLPGDVPAFLRDGNALDVIEYLGPEPDRWRSLAEPELSATQAPDHFLDLEWADLAGTPCAAGSPGCSPGGRLLPKLRYGYIKGLYAAQAKHPELNLAPDKVGTLPYQVEEVWERLKSDLRDYRELVRTNGDTSGVRDTILFEAGWLGHYVADGSQPLHISINYNGWVEKDNPHHYTTEHHIHSQFESAFVAASIKPAGVETLVAAAKSEAIDNEWLQYLDYIHHTNSLVERTYQLEKAGGFENGGTPESKAFTEERLAAGAIELRNLIYSAWVQSADPVPEYHPAQ